MVGNSFTGLRRGRFRGLGSCLRLSICLLLFSPAMAGAQSSEVQQLLLNVEKLAQMRNILSDMEKGYTVLVNGYNSIRNIAQGNFSLHEVFLDGLMMVSPEVRKYSRVADIISYQKAILSEYRNAYARFRDSGNFDAVELAYLSRVYGGLSSQSARNLDELLMVITSSQLRMSDDERMRAIDRIFAEVEEKLLFLRHFNTEAATLDLLRSRERKELGGLKQIFLPTN